MTAAAIMIDRGVDTFDVIETLLLFFSDKWMDLVSSLDCDVSTNQVD
jgi:hypothetical protein